MGMVYQGMKSERQELEAAAHMASTIGKQRAMVVSAQLASSLKKKKQRSRLYLIMMCFIEVCMPGCDMWHGEPVTIGDQLWVGPLLLPVCGIWGSDSDHQACTASVFPHGATKLHWLPFILNRPYTQGISSHFSWVIQIIPPRHAQGLTSSR